VQVYDKPKPSPAIIAAYEALNGDLPRKVLEAAIVPRTQQEYDTLARVFIGDDRVGTANNKHFSEQEFFPQPCSTPVPQQRDKGSDDRDSGIDEFEVQVDTSTQPSSDTSAQQARRLFEQAHIIASVLARDQSIVNDYNAGWVPGAHPSAFPYNKGGRPKGMSEKRWSQCVLRRYPVEQFAQNVPLIVDMFNILQRHTAYTSSHVHFKFRPRDAAVVAQMTPFDIQQVLDIMQMKPRPYGINLTNRLAAIGNYD